MIRFTCLAPLLWLAATIAAADVPHAQAAWAAGDYGTAFSEAIEPAEGGDADAQFLLGESYRLGRGAAEDRLSAEVWYFRAARRGHVAAAAALGALYAAENRAADAERWLRFAADHGDIGAQGSLAALYYNGIDGRRDVAQAVALMRKAAAAGSAQAATQLVRMGAAENIPARPMARALANPAPAATPAQPARQSLAALPGWRVQVGAFRTRQAADRAWGRVVRRVSAFGGTDRVDGFYGPLIRVQANVPDRDSALRLCRAVRSAGWPCFVRAPHRLKVARLAFRAAIRRNAL